MPKELPNIVYDDTGKSPTVDSYSSLYNIPFEKPPEFFSSLESRNNFIKGCERLVRTNDRYNKYISFLKKEVKLNHCQVLKGLTDEDCTIEMHHGPIFTLYDYCDIILNWYLKKKYKITTFRIANTVLEEHRQHRIQVVMLSTTVHEEVHNKDIFISTNQAWGNLGQFIKIYGNAIDDDLREKYNRYMDRSMMMETTTYDTLILNPKLK